MNIYIILSTGDRELLQNIDVNKLDTTVNKSIIARKGRKYNSNALHVIVSALSVVAVTRMQLLEHD